MLVLAACGDAVFMTGGEEGDCDGCAVAESTSGALNGSSSVNALPQPGSIADALDGYAAYDITIDNTTRCGGLDLRPGVQAFSDWLRPFGIIAKSYQSCQPGFHPIGQALDVYLDGSTIAGLRPFATWLTANGGEMAQRLGIVQVVFNHRMWRSYNGGSGRPQGAWGNYFGSDPHTGHIHVSFSEAGATGSTSFFTNVISPQPAGSQNVGGGLPGFTVSASGLRMTSVGPRRLVDTRNTGALAAGQLATAFTSADVGGAAAVALGVAMVTPSTDGYVSVTGGAGVPTTTSTVNAQAGAIRANQTLVSLSSGVASMFAFVATDVVIDEEARFGPSGTAGFFPLGPTRALDSRNTVAFAAGETRAISLSGVGVPASAVAVQLGLAVIPHGAAGYLAVVPCGAGPTTSALNHDQTHITSSSAIGVVANATVCLYSHVETDVVVDVAGYFDSGGAGLVLAEPARVLDTRTGQGGWQGRADANQVLQLDLTQMPGWPGSAAVAFNLTGVDATAEGFTRVWDCTGTPDHSNLNGNPGVAAGTFGVVRSTGMLCVMSNQKQNVILDLVGVYR